MGKDSASWTWSSSGQGRTRAGTSAGKGFERSKGMSGRTRIHAGQPWDKPRTGLYRGKTIVVHDMIG